MDSDFGSANKKRVHFTTSACPCPSPLPSAHTPPKDTPSYPVVESGLFCSQCWIDLTQVADGSIYRPGRDLGLDGKFDREYIDCHFCCPDCMFSLVGGYEEPHILDLLIKRFQTRYAGLKTDPKFFKEVPQGIRHGQVLHTVSHLPPGQQQQKHDEELLPDASNKQNGTSHDSDHTPVKIIKV